ncbi:TolC family protein [Niabella terrae]
MKTLFTLVGWVLAFNWVNAQSLTIEACHELAKAHYPTLKKMDIIEASRDIDIKNINNRHLPQVSFSGQLTYQSAVVDYGSLLGAGDSPSGFTPPILSKDQYRLQGEVSQLVYDGGKAKNDKTLTNTDAALQEQQLTARLYAVNSRINELYFSVLLMEAQLDQNEIRKANLQTQIQKTEAALENGVAFRSSLDELKAEIVSIEMAGTAYSANRSAYLKMLSLLIGKELPDSTTLLIPQTETIPEAINRPELKSFDLQNESYEIRKKELRTGYLPEVKLFFQGAYGKPTLNILENKFGAWYLAGIRFNWSLGSLYGLNSRKNKLQLGQQAVEADREAFLLNVRLDLSQQDEAVKKYFKLIQQDQEVINLRTSVTKSAEAQLANGVITTHEYIQKLNAAHLARQQKTLHEIQLLQAQYNQKFITGN